MIFEEVIKRSGKKFNGEEADFQMIGGQAVLLYGESCFTKVIDIVLGLNLKDVKKGQYPFFALLPKSSCVEADTEPVIALLSDEL